MKKVYKKYGVHPHSMESILKKYEVHLQFNRIHLEKKCGVHLSSYGIHLKKYGIYLEKVWNPSPFTQGGKSTEVGCKFKCT